MTTCSNCEAELTPGLGNCPKCGASVSSASQSSARDEAPPAPGPLPPVDSAPTAPQASARSNTAAVPPPPKLTQPAPKVQAPPPGQAPPSGQVAADETAPPTPSKSRPKPAILAIVGVLLVGLLVAGVAVLGGGGSEEATDGGNTIVDVTTTLPATTDAVVTTSVASTSTNPTTTVAPEPENGELLFVDPETSSDYCSVIGGFLRLKTETGHSFYSDEGELVKSTTEPDGEFEQTTDSELVVVTSKGDFVTLASSANVELGAGINPDESGYMLTATEDDGKQLWSVDARYDAPVDANADRQLHFVPAGLVDDLIVGAFTTTESGSGGYPGVVSLKDGSLLWAAPDESFDGAWPGVVLVSGELRGIADGKTLPYTGLYDAFEQIDDFVVPTGSGYRVLSASRGAVVFEKENGSEGDADGVTKNVVLTMSGEDGYSLQAFPLGGGAEVWTIPTATVEASGFSVESVGWGLVLGRTDKDFAVLDAATGKQLETYPAEQVTWVNDETNVDLKLGGSSSDGTWGGRDNFFTGSRHLMCSPYPQIVATDTPVIGVNTELNENLLSPLPK